MRDRRNTSLSISSDSSNGSAASSSRPSFNEKQSPDSPILSPTLPVPVTKENYSRPNARPRLRMTLRTFAIVCVVIVLWRFVILPTAHSTLRLPVISGDVTHHSIAVPSDTPKALMVSDKAGYSRWTVSIPQDSKFPLRGQQYHQICTKADALRDNIAQGSRLVRPKDWRRHRDYYAVDRTFLDIDQAERTGALPKSATKQHDDVCEKSLTFVLDADDASFGKSLLMLWLSYGLAKKEGRAFFVDDSRWAYGRYSSYFGSRPEPGCAQPPKHQIVPCPHSANHLLVSSATMSWTFGSSFEKEFTPSRKHGLDKSRGIFDLLRHGYEDLFIMTGEDAFYAASRLAKFKEDAYQHAGLVVGMHVRRGDLHPLEYQYSQDYLPLERYASTARKLLRAQLQATLPNTHTAVDDFRKFLEYVHSPLLLGSDDPEIFDSAELKEAAAPFVVQKAQERIQLATKTTLDLASPKEDLQEPGSAYVKHVDENSGWEGGFYSSLFFALGRDSDETGSTARDTSSQTRAPSTNVVEEEDELSDQTLRMRELVGRAYLLDLAVLGESDGVVCAVSSASCRVLGVMLGWDALEDGRWMNVDDGRPWSWDGRL